MPTIFTPKADDKFAAVREVGIEVATVKPSGYLHFRGTFREVHIPEVTEGIKAYFASEGRPEPVIYTRTIGTAEWTALDMPETVTIPDELPEDFKA